jgi:hypothetical protein
MIFIVQQNYADIGGGWEVIDGEMPLSHVLSCGLYVKRKRAI